MASKTRKTKAKPVRRIARRTPAAVEQRGSYWAVGAGLFGFALIVGAAAFVYLNEDARSTVAGMVDSINLESVNLPNSIPFFSGEEASGRS